MEEQCIFWTSAAYQKDLREHNDLVTEMINLNEQKPATLLKVRFFHECFPRFLNCTNVTKSRKASHITSH